jgi:hypothetical protein
MVRFVNRNPIMDEEGNVLTSDFEIQFSASAE